MERITNCPNGAFRKWYGNNDFVVMYENDGEEMKSYTATLPQGTWVRLKSREYYFCESVTWSFISSSHFGVRYSPGGSIFDVAGSSLFGENLKYVLGFLTTKTVVGDAVKFDDGTIILPLVDVSFGVGAGAFAGDKKNNAGGGMGGKMSPSAVLVIKDGVPKLVNIKEQSGLTKILDMVPDFIDRFTGNKGEENKEDDIIVEG